MLTDEELKKVKMQFVNHFTFSTYCISNYKSVNTKPGIYMSTLTPRDAYGPDELSEEDWKNRPKRARRSFYCCDKQYAKLETLNKHVEIKLI